MDNQENINVYIKKTLTNIYLTLNEIQLKGEQNMTYMVGSLNKIKELISTIEQQSREE